MITKWTLLKLLFSKSGFKKALRKLSEEELNEYQKKAVLEENYELASYISYYIEFRRFKTKIT
ncbi:MAG: hypothetical protein ACFFKA_19865 [Candidatus Thorarchaeota archaeon]